MKLMIKAVPGASRNEIVGWVGDALKVRVRAVAEKGGANQAICELIAQTLGVPISQVAVQQGMTSARKLLNINLVDETTARETLSHLVTRR